jgi:hypothetical protein
VSEPGTLIIEFAKLLSDDGTKIRSHYKLDNNRLETSKWSYTIVRQNFPDWAREEQNVLFHHIDILKKATRTADLALGKLSSRIPTMIRDKVAKDTVVIAGKIRRKSKSLFSPSGNAKLGEEYYKFIKALKITPEDTFEMSTAIVALDKYRNAIHDFLNATKSQQSNMKKKKSKPSLKINSWLKELSSQSEKLMAYDNDTLAMLQYLQGIRNLVNHINHKISLAVEKLGKINPADRLPHSKCADIANSLYEAEEYLREVALQNKRDNMRLRESLLFKETKAAGAKSRASSNVFKFWKSMAVVQVATTKAAGKL